MIREVGEEDEAEYHCEVRNIARVESSDRAMLTVVGEPSTEGELIFSLNQILLVALRWIFNSYHLPHSFEQILNPCPLVDWNSVYQISIDC